jgi:hypothetical protein
LGAGHHEDIGNRSTFGNARPPASPGDGMKKLVSFEFCDLCIHMQRDLVRRQDSLNGSGANSVSARVMGD